MLLKMLCLEWFRINSEKYGCCTMKKKAVSEWAAVKLFEMKDINAKKMFF